MGNNWAHILGSVAPFLVLLAIWFFLLAGMRKNKWGWGYRKNIVEPMREVLQSDIVPEIRALRESVDALRKEMADRR